MAKENADYAQTINPQGYVNNREITNLPGLYLVRGSRDCVIVNKEKVVSRKGFALVGSAKTKNKGHRSSIDWETNRNITHSIRMNNDGEVEVYFASDWHLIKDYAALTRANFVPWWSDTEMQDLLLFTIQTDGVQMWSGGAVQVASSTATTITMQGYRAATTIAFVEGGAGVDDTITDSASGFVTAGFAVGDVITISGSGSNDGSYTIKTVAAGTLTLSSNDDLVAEAAGASVVITRPNATWAASGFLTAGTRKVIYGGVEYAYTGGESSAILTGLSGFPAVTAGDVVLQAVIESTPATLDGLTLDLISVFNNHVFYGDLTSREWFMSKSSDYADFTLSTPRVPGEGASGTLDSTPTAFVPAASGENFGIFGRKDDYYEFTFTLSADIGDESIRVKKYPTATGQAAQSQAGVVRIKNGVAFLNFEPTIDTISRILSVETPSSAPISDDIKDDLLLYDLTDAHGLFYQNQVFYCLPAEGILLIYDVKNQHWQPPHYVPIGRLALIDIDGDGTQRLCGHSASSNETYELYTGYNDNGAPLSVEMRFGYENNGSRFTQKGADEFATELYMSENTNVTNQVVYDYRGASGVREFEIRGDDDTIRFRPVEGGGGGLGFNPLGSDPLGSLASSVEDLSKYRAVDTTEFTDHFERQRAFIASGVDIRFAVIAYGDNVELSDNIPASIKR